MTILIRKIAHRLSAMVLAGALFALPAAYAQQNSVDHGQVRAEGEAELGQLVQDSTDRNNRCAARWDEVRQFIGPVDSPLEPRDKICAAYIEDNGLRKDGFKGCSETYFGRYDAAHEAFRQCHDEQLENSTAIIALRRSLIETDIQARRLARARGNAPAEVIEERGWLGIRFDGISKAQMQRLALTSQEGVIVDFTQPGSPAAKAGLLSNDVIIGFNDTPITDSRSFRNTTRGLQAGQLVVLKVQRLGALRYIYIAVEER